MSMASRMPLDRSVSAGDGSFETRKFRKIDRFSQWALVYGSTADRKP
jgi:hypothetical protein